MRRIVRALLMVSFVLVMAAGECKPKSGPAAAPAPKGEEPSMSAESEKWFAQKREAMVRRQIEERGVQDPLVLKAMRKVPRQRFVPENSRPDAYNDYPLPIGHNQTISQPYIVAFMTEQLGLRGGEKVLEVGTGSGYQAAVLAEIAGAVYSIEIICELADSAQARLKILGYKNITVRCGDGYRGWPEQAPFDAIIVTAAPGKIPQPLLDQLKPGGRMVIPVGELMQELVLVSKLKDGRLEEKNVLPVRFVPMKGEAEKRE